MVWVLLDAAVAVAALIGLMVVLLRLWRRVKRFGNAVSVAGDEISAASAQLAEAQARSPHAR